MKTFSIILTNFYSLIPLIISLFFTFFSVLPFVPYEISLITPLLGIITCIFWIINKPDLMTWSSVLIIGLVHDLLLGLTLGTSCLSLIIVRYSLVKLMYKYDGNSTIFSFFCILVGLFIWLILVVIMRTIIEFQFFNYTNVLFQYLLSVAFSPVMIFLNKFINNKLKF